MLRWGGRVALAWGIPTGARDDPITQVAVGVRLPPLSGYGWGAAPQTLVLGLRVGCVHCENEMRFYERLLMLSRQGAIHARLVAVFPDPKAQVELADADRLKGLLALPGVDPRQLRILATPTLVLVDSDGVVKRIWVGELSSDEEGEVLGAIEELKR